VPLLRLALTKLEPPWTTICREEDYNQPWVIRPRQRHEPYRVVLARFDAVERRAVAFPAAKNESEAVEQAKQQCRDERVSYDHRVRAILWDTGFTSAEVDLRFAKEKRDAVHKEIFAPPQTQLTGDQAAAFEEHQRNFRPRSDAACNWWQTSRLNVVGEDGVPALRVLPKRESERARKPTRLYTAEELQNPQIAERRDSELRERRSRAERGLPAK
jgi:hypothetical protein